MQSQKTHFSLQPDAHYLNCAYKAPLLKAAENAAIEALIRERNPMHVSAQDFFTETAAVRRYFAAIINASSENIAIIPSSSYGFAAALNNIQGKKNGHAITIQDEFPSGYFSLQRWCAENDNTLIVVKPTTDGPLKGENWNANLLEQINANTSVVLISSVHWMNGLKFDLEAIGRKCREVGAKFIVDGTQSVGALPMDVQQYKIDALICATYKWLLGPYSLVLAYYDDAFETGKPIEESWMNRKNAENFSLLADYEPTYQPKSARYNVGETANFILMPMLRESLKQIIAWEPARIQAYGKKLIQPFLQFARERGIAFEEEPYFSHHLFGIQVSQYPNIEQLKQRLLDRRVYVSVRGNHLRISVNVFNEAEDVAALVEGLKE